jgi:Alpha/beta hydrolase of unknown function (DUF900)
MSHYITVPINENGVIFDPVMNGVVADAMAPTPFGFEDVYLYSHGWSTDADRALDLYNQFSIELSKQIMLAMAVPAHPLVNPPRNSLGIGIHWPSEITEDPSSPLTNLQLFTFYTMEHRADAIGKNAVYSMLRLLLSQRPGQTLPLRLFLLGHSFGCKVVCSALNDLQIDIANGTIAKPANLSFRVVLLEPATDQDNLEPTDIYGSICSIANLRMLITTSALDEALNKWYLLASGVANFFHGNRPIPALGAAGPTADTIAAFGGATAVTVPLGFTAALAAAPTSRLVIADLSPAHQARVTSGDYKTGGISGSHSDINFTEIYELVMGFIFA